MSSTDLTAAELDIVQKLLGGMHHDQVAQVRGTSRSTVTRQIDHIKLKAGVRTLLQLGAWAERHGIREAQG